MLPAPYEFPKTPEQLKAELQATQLQRVAKGEVVTLPPAQVAMLERGMPKGVPQWALDMGQQYKQTIAPQFASTAGLTNALAAQAGADPTRGAMANYRYGLEQQAGASKSPMSYAMLGKGAQAAGGELQQARNAQHQGLLNALTSAGQQDARVGASGADWALQRSALARQLAGMAMGAKQENFNRELDDARAGLFQGQIDLRRSLADSAARSQASTAAMTNLAAGVGNTVSSGLAMWPSGSGADSKEEDWKDPYGD